MSVGFSFHVQAISTLLQGSFVTVRAGVFSEQLHAWLPLKVQEGCIPDVSAQDAYCPSCGKHDKILELSALSKCPRTSKLAGGAISHAGGEASLTGATSPTGAASPACCTTSHWLVDTLVAEEANEPDKMHTHPLKKCCRKLPVWQSWLQKLTIKRKPTCTWIC